MPIFSVKKLTQTIMKKQLIFLLAAITVIVFSCQKELSFEGSNQPAEVYKAMG